MSDNRGEVTVNNRNLGQGSFPECERMFLFLGIASKNHHKLLPLDTQSDFDVDLGDTQSTLKTNIEAARINAGQNWQAYAMPLADDDTDIMAAIDTAMESCSPEFIVICDEVYTAKIIKAFHDKSHAIRGELGRQVGFLIATQGIDNTTQTWADYYAVMESLVDDIAANRVAAIPQLHGNDIGVLAGRLCDRKTSIADSPMRVRTGALLALGDVPTDLDGQLLPEAILAALSKNRYSTVQHYKDYPGDYWADCPMLEVPTGDYQVIEYLRVAMKAARNVRLLGIYRVGDRLLNSTPQSIEANKAYFARPLREMSQSITLGEYVFPGEIKTPTEDAITITWLSNKKVNIGISLCPYKSPKTIEMDIVLDLTTSEG